MISANTIFHFTNSIENIKNILTKSFQPRYCLERIDYLNSNEKFDFAIPMVCFCDIPLSQITEHINTYGHYAIGLKKDWALNKGISPIIYIHPHSRTNIIFNGFFQNSIRLDSLKKYLTKENSVENSLEALEFMFYLKKYKGDMWRNSKLQKDIMFYNEREWRYVPQLREILKINPRLILNKDLFNDEKVQKVENEKISCLDLGFVPNDIKYIIVNKETERIDMSRAIEEIKGNSFTHNDLTVLKSKIISVEQIREDF